jgi:uncharacterized protein (DUF1800 family)
MKMREVAACLLTGLLLLPPGFAGGRTETDAARTQSGKPFETKLGPDKQIMHALDRLTFGPRPGDIERVRAMGLKKWIDEQLYPERIPENPALEVKLAPLETLRLSTRELAQRYPPPQMIKAIADGRQPLPADPIIRAAVARQVERLKAKLDPNAAPGESDDPPPARPLAQVLSPQQIDVFRSGTPEEKRQMLASLPEPTLDAAIISMPRAMRQRLMPIASTVLRRKLVMLNQAPLAAVAYDLMDAKLLRAVYSNRQFAEGLDDFWFNHFNVFFDKGADRFLIPEYERDAIRPHVLGKFRDLLEATAKSPAMLFYLDNFESVRADLDANAAGKRVKRGLNENYGRELMELHTLGVNGGYTQKDVIEVARCFTGWTIEQPGRGGAFRYNDRVHDKGQKVVLGHVIPAGGGENDGEKVLDILAHHPSTARFISRELAQRFVSDNPPEALVDRMAKTFLTKDGDIREVLKTMFGSREFWSEGAYRAKVKTPFEMVVSAVRAVDANVDDAFALANQINQLGEPLYRKQEPTGYSNLNSEWVNSAALLGRMNFALALVQNKIGGVKVDAGQFGDGSSDASALARKLLFRDVTPLTRASIEKALQNQPAGSTLPPSTLLAGLVLGSPDFQRR